ncbi:MAG TPA: POTRA domain-containing protein [Flavobacteriaceae bacterium]|nr:POTRA domain-containing protein [Flavobacteriaceae bacterium]
MTKKLILYHIIYITFVSVTFGQDLHLKIIGSDETETKILDSLGYKKTHPNYITLQAETDSVFSKVTTQGFLEAKLNTISKVNDSSFVSTIALGRIYKYVTIHYQDSILKSSYLKNIALTFDHNTFTLAIPKVKTALHALNSLIAQNGYPFAGLQLTNLSVDENQNVTATLTVSLNGKKRRVDDIVVKGYEKFPKSYLKHFLKIKKTTLFNLSKIKEKTELLNNLRFANQAREPEVLFTGDSTLLYLYLTKVKSNTFDGFLGFGTNEESNKIEFDGYLNLELNNNLNGGETFKLLYKSDEIKQKTFNANLSLPYVFNSPVGIELGLTIFKKDTLFTTTNQIINATYQVNSRHLVKTGLENITSNNIQSTIVNGVDDYKTNLYKIGHQYLSQNNNNQLFRINAYVYSEIGFGKRTLNSTQSHQTQFKFDAHKIFSLNEKNKFYTRINTHGLVSDSYLENELFRFGGINSIRGFEENSLTATLFGVVNTEYRYLLSPTIYAHTIIDFSYLENKLLSQKEKLFGFGFGFGILTQAGLFKLIYANGKNENQAFKLSNSKIHLSLNAYF